MRTLTRTALLLIAVLVLSELLGGMASARPRLIHYVGETSAPTENAIEIDVLKKADGRRLLKMIAFDYTLTCEDASTELHSHIVYAYRADRTIGKDGSFSYVDDDPYEFERFEGDIGFHHAEGTLVVNVARLTDDHQDTQLCTTGPLTWTAERT
jgi:hypothetical protein